MLGASWAMENQGLGSWLPVYGSPTVCLMQKAEVWSESPDSNWIEREALTRGACVGAVALAIIESFAHVLTAVGASVGMVFRATVRTVLRAIGGVLGGTWWWMYGNTISFDFRVWIQRIIIGVVIFSRGIGVALDHWMERRVVATDHLFMGVRFWAYAMRANDAMKGVFSFQRVAHHAGQSWNYLAFAGSTLFAGAVSPEVSLKRCKALKLGSGMPGPTLVQRVYNGAIRHWWSVLAVATVALGVWRYSGGQYEGINDLGGAVADDLKEASGKLFNVTFGLVFGFAGDLVTLVKTTIDHMKAEMEFWKITGEHYKLQEDLWRKLGPSLARSDQCLNPAADEILRHTLC